MRYFASQENESMQTPRASGILLHPSSLPGPDGVGNFGASAYAFVDFLAAAGQTLWQMLPLTPPGYGESPYSAFSAFAGNPLLIAPEQLVAVGDLTAADLVDPPLPEGTADFAAARARLSRILPLAAQNFARQASPDRRAAFEHFCREAQGWLEDYVLFAVLHAEAGGAPWNSWPAQVRCRESQALASARKRLAGELATARYAQFVFAEQWTALKSYANARGIHIVGDMPIFVAYDSADVWARPGLFHLDADGAPTVVAGVPPDYFSATGQRWGNPLYRWEAMVAEGFAWWRERFRAAFNQSDLLRIDHFRGFEACWTIPAAEPTAVRGRWELVPGGELFQVLQAEFGSLPVIAEDLGVITPEVEALRDRFAFPGMKILQFAFGSDAANPYLPHNLTHNCVVYTGTHDNDTTVGWWRLLPLDERHRVCEYLDCAETDGPQALLRAALASVAQRCILPLQDVLGFDSEARMNRPGVGGGNWGWRFRPGDLRPELAARLAEWTVLYGRKS
jgi:4-alpha-glucanotransferase